MEDDGVVQGIGEVAAASRAHFDDFYLVAVFDGLGQALADMAAAGDQDVLVAFVQAAHFAHHRADVGFGGDEEYFVIGLDYGVALGQDRLVAAEYRRYAGVDVGHVRADLAQFLSNQRAAIVGAYGHQLRLAAGEVDHLQRAGNLDQAPDVVGHHLIGADQD